jgi:DNA-binding MarR family transcriptional regulator
MCFTVYSTNLAYSRVYRPVLEQLGLTRDIHDERSVLVSLTEEGRLLREKGLEFGAKTVAASGLSADEFRMLQKAIAKLRDNLITSAEQG